METRDRVCVIHLFYLKVLAKGQCKLWPYNTPVNANLSMSAPGLGPDLQKGSIDWDPKYETCP